MPSDILHRHIALRMGSRELLRMGGGAGRRYMDLALIGYALDSFTRADASTCATYIGPDNLLHLAPANRMRLHWLDLNGDGIAEQPVILLEATDQNILLRSEEINDAAWGKTRTTVLADAVAGPRVAVTADKLREDASAATTHYLNQQVTITAGEDVAGLVFLQAAERTRVLFRLCDAGTTRGIQCDVNMTTRSIVSSGAFGGNGATLKLAPIVLKLAGTWMGIGMVGVIDTATTTLANLFLYMCDNTGNASYTGDGASGFYVGAAQFQRASMFGSYIPTAGSAVTRASDRWDILTSLVPEPCTIYLKFVELGTMRTGGADGNRLFKIGQSVPGVWIQASNNNAYNVAHHNGVGQVGSAVATACQIMDVVELVVQLDPSGKPQLFQSRNGGAWEVAAQGGANALASRYGVDGQQVIMEMNRQGTGLEGRMGLINFLLARSVLVDPDTMRAAAAA